MKELTERINAVIGKYSEELDKCGINISASKRYFESKVGERIRQTGKGAVFNGIDHAIDRRKEKEKGYGHQPNRYHCIVLSVSPAQKGIVRREECREYAFVLKKVERAHIGMEPKKVMYAESKLLSEIEKRIVRILSKAEKTSAEKVCRDTLLDALRYTCPRYGYKRRFLNKDREDWDIIFVITSGVFALAVIFLLWYFSR